MMNRMNLVVLADYFLRDDDLIILQDRHLKPSTDKFIAVGIEKSKPSDHWEVSDLINIIILVKGEDQQYYITKIEHNPRYILTPKYVEDENNIKLIEKPQFINREIIEDIYAFSDSREKYTLNIFDKDNRYKIYQIYERYFTYKISIYYETEDYQSDTVEAAIFFWVSCQLDWMQSPDNSERLENDTIQYEIFIRRLLQASVFKPIYFKPYDGKVTINGIKVTIE